MKAKLGMSPIAWWNDDLPELGDDVSLEECLRQSRVGRLHRHGDGPPLSRRPRGDAPILQAADVTLCGGWFSGTLVDEDLAANKDRIRADDRAVQGGGRALHRLWRSRPLDPGRPRKPLATKPKLTDDEMKAYARKVTAFGEWCAEQGMPLAYHHHMAAVVETEPELDAFMARIRATAFRCCSMPATSPSPAATCCAPSTTTTRASPMSTSRTSAGR